MKVTPLCACLIFVFGWTAELRAQFVPVIAKQRSTHYLMQNDGTETEVIRQEGTYFRSSSGSVLNTMLHVKGPFQGKHESVQRDSSTKKIYVLDHKLKKAILKQVSKEPFRPVVLRPSLAVGEGVIEGLDCIAMRVISPNDPDESIGKVWWARDAKLMVKSETDFGPGRIVEELYDIEFNEPDPSVFKSLADYKIDDTEWKSRKRRELSKEAGKE